MEGKLFWDVLVLFRDLASGCGELHGPFSLLWQYCGVRLIGSRQNSSYIQEVILTNGRRIFPQSGKLQTEPRRIIRL